MIRKLLCWLGLHDPRVKETIRGSRPGERPGLYHSYRIFCAHCGKEAS